jgi:hypothetical protein
MAEGRLIALPTSAQSIRPFGPSTHRRSCRRSAARLDGGTSYSAAFARSACTRKGHSYPVSAPCFAFAFPATYLARGLRSVPWRECPVTFVFLWFCRQ